MAIDRKALKQLLPRPLGGLRTRLKDHARLLAIRSLRAVGLGDQVFGHPLTVEQERDAVSNYTVLYPAEVIDFGDPARDKFLRSCQYIQDGLLSRDNIFVCEVNGAKFFPEIGLVFSKDWRPIMESILDQQRFHNFKGVLRPRTVKVRAGVFSSVQHLWHTNAWHWTADSLTQVYSLVKYMDGRPLTLLMSHDIGQVHRATLECLLPPNFSLEYVDPSEWLELETFILPSHVSSRANACFPKAYYDYIRVNTFRHVHVSRPAVANGRYYISRSRAKHRRVTNEPEIVAMLAEFGFQNILIEDYNFKEQVELFRGSEAIVSPHGAALGGILYADDLKVSVLYPEARPAGYFYTMAHGLGHQHFCLNGNSKEDDDFYVDPEELRRVVVEEMHLEPIATEVILGQNLEPAFGD
jgi:hypothetical protein